MSYYALGSWRTTKNGCGITDTRLHTMFKSDKFSGKGALKQMLLTSNLYKKDYVRFVSVQSVLVYGLSIYRPQLKEKMKKSKNNFTIAWKNTEFE